MFTENYLLANKITGPITNANTKQQTSALLEPIAPTAPTTLTEFTESTPNTSLSKYPSTMNLLEFCRLYKIGQIPIIDFVIGYIILYSLNSLCTKYDYKLVLISSIIFVIVFNLIVNPDVKPTVGLGIACIISVYYLLTSKYTHN